MRLFLKAEADVNKEPKSSSKTYREKEMKLLYAAGASMEFSNDGRFKDADNMILRFYF